MAEPTRQIDDNSGKIQLISETKLSSLYTKAAVTNLIGAGDIGVIGALYPAENAPVDWTSYPDLDNVKAGAVSRDGDGVYSFKWETQKYWPFDSTQLLFKAYYPHTDNAGGHVNLSTDRNNLALTLPSSEPDAMPDVMVASGNMDAIDRPLNKLAIDGMVNLGEFRHVLSQLTVQVVRKDNNVDAELLVNNLTVSTESSIASLTLDSANLEVTPDNEVSYKYISDPILLTNVASGGYTALLFPGTQDDVWVSIEVGKGGSWVTRSFPVSSFINVDPDNPDVALERAKKTTLKIEIAGIPVQNSLQLDLKATLSEWNQKGDFVVNIK